jgi:hypothetical protein
MTRHLLAVGASLIVLAAAQIPARLVAGELAAARGGKAALSIVVNRGRSQPPEQTAAKELAETLGQMTGAKFQVLDEPQATAGTPAIYVGDTDFARAQGIDAAKLGPEESVLRTVGQKVILAGGRPRGALYAVYELLDDTLGCRWYTPWCVSIPHRPTLLLPEMNRSVRPAYVYRHVYTYLDEPRVFPDRPGYRKFSVRNRLNGGELEPDWGGSVRGGPVDNHSFVLLVPSEKYFKSHPEYFSERGGKRVAATEGNGEQLCLTNPDVLRIATAEVKRQFHDYPQATFISVSINDGGKSTICDCPRCRAVAREEGESGLLLKFVNAIAEAVKDDFPNKYILTLAYNATALPPKRIHARDNVIVFVCQGGRTNLVHLPEGTDTAEFRILRQWSTFAPHIWVWDYACNVDYGLHFFRPMIWQFAEQSDFYRRLRNVDGVFQELELGDSDTILYPQFYEMYLWIYARLCRRPDLPLDGLIDDFLHGYYGQAGPALRRYVELVKKRVPKYPYRMFDYPFAAQAQACFDEAEQAAAGDPALRERVEALRIHLDLAMLAWRNTIQRDWLAQGRTLEQYPFPVRVLKGRLLDRIERTKYPLLRATVVQRTPNASGGTDYAFVPVVNFVKRHVETLASGKEYAPLPEAFQKIPADRMIDLTAATFGWEAAGGGIRVEPDADGALGHAYRYATDKAFPMPIGIYGTGPDGQKLGASKSVAPKDVTGPGYHWYRGPRFTPIESTWVYLTADWRFQTRLWSEFDPKNPQQQWDVYVSMKATGPAYPHGKAGEPNAIAFDRLILVRVNPDEKPVVP